MNREHAPPPPTRKARTVAVHLLAALTLALTLGACGSEPALPPLPGVAPDQKVWFWRDVLAAPLPGEAAPLGALLSLPDAVEREAALGELLAADPETAVMTLMPALRDANEGVAAGAARRLGLLGDERTLPRLIKGLGPYPVDYDVPISVRVAQASALARLGHPAGVDLLLAVLAEDTPRERDRASLVWEPTERMVFLRELALEGATALLGESGYEPNGSMPAREAAVQILVQRWAERAPSLWASTLAFDSPGLKTRVRLLVAHLGSYQLRQIDGARFTLAELGPLVLPDLRAALQSPSSYLRLHALEVMTVLAQRHDQKTRVRLAVVAAGPLLEDALPEVAAQAARVCGAARVADPLVVALDRRREPEVVLAVVDGLGSTGLPVAAEALARFVPSEPVAPDLLAALAAARYQLAPGNNASELLALLAETDADRAYPAIERLVSLTGSDQGLRPGQPADEQAAALTRAADALAARAR